MQTHSAIVPGGGMTIASDHSLDNTKLQPNELDQQAKMPPTSAPQATFERTSFDQLLRQYDLKHDLPPTLELTQAFLLTQNMKETASRVSGLTAGGTGYFLKNEYVGDSMRLADAMQSVSRLLGNLGTSDKASNFLLEQRKLMKAQAKENKPIRDCINQNIVDGLEYVRTKEKLAQTKTRMKDMLELEFTSDEELIDPLSEQIESNKSQSNQNFDNHKSANGKSEKASETQEDSEEAAINKRLNEKRIKTIIKQLRQDAKEYLTLRDSPIDINIDQLTIPKIFQKLQSKKKYKKRREMKALNKGVVDSLESTVKELKQELESLNEYQKINNLNKSKTELQTLINNYELYTGLEKRLQTFDPLEKSITEIDSYPLNQRSFELQNILLNFCGIDAKGQKNEKIGKRDIFGKIVKLPSKSPALQGYQDQNVSDSKNTNENGLIQQARKKNQEIVKMIGLDPEKLLQSLDKYKAQIDKMPKFSNVFERAEPIIPGLGMTVASSIIAQNQGGQMTFARVDGRNVISLQFSPYELEDPTKKKQYEQAIKEVDEQRQKIKSISKQAREKQEQSNIKRAWLNIVKKDIPKAYRQFQKYQVDKENNNKKQSQNCLKEVRKKAFKTQKMAKESAFRGKKLTKEMCNFWKKRDKEIADLKRKKEKVEKELKRKQEEEKETLLQKKRLEFIMQQSEIYAHFMSKKLGLADEQKQQRHQDLEEEEKDNFRRVDIDESQARQNVASMINENLSRVGQFDQETYNKQFSKSGIDEEELEVDKFDNPVFSKDSEVIKAPSCFLGQLKDYQLKGMRWLDNLYEQGINGILADEMGLGKTIQAISLLANLYENKGVWGPFLIIVPVTTLHNWQNELAKFCPCLKVLPYFGSPEERKKLGKFLDPKNMQNANMRINIILTSYNLIVNNSKDQQKLLKIKWHYMILDEAQAIKNNLSRRWKVLLQFQTRNRLLLTGTPIQNSMAELWALLHFIMPRLFDSHEQFQEWFSKDIENHSFNNQGEINKHQLRRLHLVLKPFMLRRLKKDVEAEIGPKFEYDRYCDMTHRQRVLYNRIKSKISAQDLFQLVENKAKMENLMNLVMQFRKVCNHPELFERRIGRIPLSFKQLQHATQPNIAFQSIPDLRTQVRNPIIYEIPQMVFDECFLATDNMTRLYRKIRKGVDEPFQEIGFENHMRFFNIFNTLNIHEESFKSNSGFGILRLLIQGNGWSAGELSYLFVSDPLIKQIALMHYHHQKTHRRFYQHLIKESESEIFFNHLQIGQTNSSNKIDINIIEHNNREYNLSMFYRENKVIDKYRNMDIVPPMVTDDLNTFTNFSRQLRKDLDIFVDACLAEPVQYFCRSGQFNRFLTATINSSLHKKALIGSKFKPRYEIHLGRIGKDRSSFLATDTGSNYKAYGGLPTGYPLIENGIMGDTITEKGASILELPNYSRLVSDCAKMQFLDQLLTKLQKGNHRVLIFCQMTRMLDILEDFLCWKKYTYFRMDGSTTIPDRRYMVEEYQKNPDIFAFLLSTRAGGLGVNLVAADTVIFYDNDWNPTMDAQATDRAHRIGQTKAVSVYRLITRKTVEEKIVKRAKQKQTVQSTVYGGSALKADVFKPKDVIDMVFDDEEQNDLKERGQKFLKTKRMKKFKQVGGSNQHHHEDDDIDMKGDTAMINTVSKEEKKKSTPIKQVIKKDENAVPKKPGRKPNPDKQQKPSQNIFSTVKATASVSGPFSVTKAIANKVSEIPEDDEQEYDEEDNENQEEEDDEGQEDVFDQLFDGDNMAIEYQDEDNPQPQLFEDEDEGGGSKLESNKKQKIPDLDEDDEMQDDY